MNKGRKYFCLVHIFLLTLSLAANSDSTHVKRRRVEFALNITNAISRFSGNGVKNILEDPYLMALKFQSKSGNSAWRAGFNQFYSSQRTDLFPGSRVSSDMYFSPILGHEWRIHLDNNFMFFYGLDGRMAWRNGQVQSSTDSGLLTINYVEKASGIGPICGFAWKINHRVMLYTEANFYVNYQTVKRTFSDGASTTVLENSAMYTVSPVIPTSIFLSINF